MRTQRNRNHSARTFFALAAWASLPCITSCSSGDEALAGGHLAHPKQRTPIPATSAQQVQDGGPAPPSDSFSSLDRLIANDCRSQPPPYEYGPRVSGSWSVNVPDRDCTNDGECGEGFCDRGRCAIIWTCYEKIGQRCVNGRAAPSPVDGTTTWCAGICLEGRCRSCESDAECINYLGHPKAFCGDRGQRGRRCGAPVVIHSHLP